MTDKPTLDDRVQVATVTHKLRVAAVFAAFTWAALAAVFWVTATPRRWAPITIALACGAALYAALR
ncbi:MAG: hypothetical protein ACYCPT_02115 [Acidimicrobiales bacterium]